MKTRVGFVSNSSSCSFTCPACGRSFSGYDWEDPTCPSCGIDINDMPNNAFAKWICERKDFNYDKLLKEYIKELKENQDED